MSETIDHLIINSPYEKPRQHWEYDREKRFFQLVEGRRPAGYLSSSGAKGFDDPGIFHELPLVNQIRKRVDAWRENNYPGVTGITKKLLEYWNNADERRDSNRFFFCQMESIETMIWLKEAPDSEKQGINIPSDGGPFQRICCKMATGTGKTIVMGMLFAWQVLNKVAYPTDARFSKKFLVVAPGLTVKKRLEVLDPDADNNIYNEFRIVPSSLYDNLRQGKIVIHNWHLLMPLEENPKSVVKKGKESDEAFTRRILGHTNSNNFVVINDEAHHAWRVKPDEKIDLSEELIEEATRWMEGLDRLHKTRNIITCYDFSATPFIPTGKGVSEETLYDWIVSDFSLNDAIESGLVKTPRIAIRDDGRFGKDYHSRFYHIYVDPDVKGDISRRAKAEEPLPDLVKNAYFVLGKDWLEAKKLWAEKGSPIPPVMITVCNRTETAARIEFSFKHKRFEIEGLDDAERILHIDSKVLKEAESKDTTEGLENTNDGTTVSLKDKGEMLRKQVATVGKVGKAGEKIQNIIAVAMLSEGWDAKTVTHIMGLRAFTSQLLCEQVVGRGLRRTSYEPNPETGLFEPEYVNVFGIPFTFLPVEGSSRVVPQPPKPTTCIEPYKSKKQYEITWPNIIRIDRTYAPKLSLHWDKVEALTINPEDTPLIVDLAPVIDGKPHVDKISTIDIEKLGKKFRLQTSIFKITREIYDKFKPDWKGNKEYLLMQIVRLVEEFLKSGKIVIANTAFEEELRRRVLISLNMSKIVHHIWSVITFQNIESTTLVFDKEKPIRSTADMMPWYTSRPNEYTGKSHISHAVVDSRWEQASVFELERNENVEAWVRNDHLGFDISYVYEGVVHKYWPDFVIRLKNGIILVLEIKGQDTEKDRTKRKYLDEWVKAVNPVGRFGRWSWDVAFAQSEVRSIIRKHSESGLTTQHN